MLHHAANEENDHSLDSGLARELHSTIKKKNWAVFFTEKSTIVAIQLFR